MGIGGVHRFLNRVWTVTLDPPLEPCESGRRGAGQLPDGQDARPPTRRWAGGPPDAARCVTDDYAGFRLNTMVAHLMELTNLLMRYRGTSRPRNRRRGGRGCCC